MGTSKHKDGSINLAFPAGHFIVNLGFGFSELVPSSLNESLQEVFFALLQLQRFTHQPHRFLADQQGSVPKLLRLRSGSDMGHVKNCLRNFFRHLIVPLWQSGYGSQVGNNS